MTTSTSFAQMANKQSISLSSALRANTPPTKGQTTSRKFLTLSIFFLLSFFCTTNAWGAEVTISVSSDTWTNTGTSGSGGTTKVSKSGVTVSSNKGYKDGTTAIREYSGGIITVSSSSNITKIVFTSTSSGTSNNGPSKISINSGGGNYSYSGSDGTWTGTSSTVKFDCDAQFRWKQVVVTTASATKYTVTWNVNGEVYETTQVTEGSKPTFPTTPASCDDESDTFYGWATTTWDGKINDVNGKTIYTSANDMPEVNGAVTYYAVFAKETTTTGGTTTTEKTITEDFEKQTAGSVYNSTQTYTAANSNAGIAWKMYYGTVSTNACLSGLKSAQMRWYDDKPSNLPYVQTTAIVKGLKSISFKTLTSDNDYKYSVSYSTNGTSWTSVATGQSVGSTSSTQTKSYTINANGADAYIKIAITSTSNVSDKATFRIDDVVFTYLETTSGGGGTTTYSDYITTCATETSVTLNLNEGTGGTTLVTATYGQPMPTITPPTRAGYTLTGYFDAASGGTKYYNADGTSAKKWDKEAATTTLYAQWTPIEYTLPLESSLSCVTNGSIKIAYNATSAKTFTPATRDDYTCTGYWSAPSGGVKVLNADGSFAGNDVDGFITDGKWINTTATKLTPHWETEYKMILSKGTEENGTYTLSPTTIETSSCATLTTRQVTITATPNTGYEVDQITYSGAGTATPKSGPTLGAGKTTWVYTFAENDKGTGTFTVTFKSLLKYTVTLVPGSGSVTSTTITESSAGKGVELPTPTLDCGEWKFAGWKTTSAVTTETTTEPTLHSAGSNYKPSADCTLYAVYSKTETTSGGSGDYELVTSEPSDWSGTYLIVNTDDAKAWKGSATSDNNAIDVTITNNTIASTATTDAETFTIATMTGGYSICGASGKYISGTSESNATNYKDAAQLNTISIDNNNNVTITSNTSVLRQNNSNASLFRYYKSSSYSSQHPIQLYRKSSGGSTTYYHSTPDCGTPEPLPTYTITWMANGLQHDSQTDEEGKTIILPTNPDASTYACDGKVFVGWTATPINGSTDTEPNDLFTVSPGDITGNATYYAVFATKSTGSGETTIIKTETFSNQTSHQSESNWQQALTWGAGESNIGVQWTTYYGKIDNGYTEIRTYSNEEMGYIWSSQKIKGIKSIQFNGWHVTESDAADMVVSYSKNNDNDWIEIGTHTAGNSPDSRSEVYTIPEAGPEEEYYISIDLHNATCPSSSNKKYRIDNISLTILEGANTPTTYSGYVTTCDNTKATITYDLNGGTGATCEQTTVTKDEAFNLCSSTPTKNGYTFAGWSDGTKTYAPGSQAIVSESTTFYAAWTVKTIKITWDQNYTDCPESETSTYIYDGEDIEMPEDPIRTGYKFTGWFTAATDGTQVTEVGETNKPTADVIYYAHWAELYTVTFMASGQVYVKQEYKYASGEKLVLPETDPSAANFACDGYLFEGWSKYQQTKEDANCPELVDANTLVENDLELHAVWKKASTSGAGTQIFYESFDTEEGSGANDEDWGNDVGTETLVNDTWTFANGHGAYHCVKLGSSKNRGSATTPALTQLSGDAKLSFKAAAWVNNNETTTLNLSISGGGTLTPTSVTMVKGAWTTYEVQITDGTPSSTITFAAANASNNRFFLDEVMITTSGSYNYTTSPSCGPTMVARDNVWVTSANGQSVKVNVPLGIKLFEGNATITGTSTNENFVVNTLENAGNGEHQVVVVYTPTADDTKENTTITLTAKNGEDTWATTTFVLNGRSLPNEFVVVANRGDKNYALPANMAQANVYAGLVVEVNGEEVIAAPKSYLYNIRAVHSTRFDENGTAIRLVGNNDACLWASTAKDGTSIRNYANISNATDSQYEWNLYTEDGDTYYISSTAVTEEGRVLRLYGNNFGMYKEGVNTFRFFPVGCTSTPMTVQTSTTRTSATISWTNASECNVVVKQGSTTVQSISAAASPVVVSNLAESTAYTFTLTPADNESCVASGAFTTTGPTIDIVEWETNGILIQVDKDNELNPKVVIKGEEEHGNVGGNVADELFFSKYFEAHAENKLLAIFNGTTATIDLTGYTIKSENGTLDLSQFGQTKGKVASNEEIILVYYDANYSAEKCAEEQQGYENWNILTEKSVLAFSGRGSIGLYKNDVLIDVIGSVYPSGELTKIGKAGKPDYCGTEDDVRLHIDGNSVNDESSFFCFNGDNIKTDNVETDYALSTNRCLLIRKNTVTSGANAVATNKATVDATCGELSSTFATLCSEWSGFRIGSGKSSTDEIKNATCDGLGYVGGFDYNNYYRTLETLDDRKTLEDYTRNPDENTYFIEIEDLAQYSCLNIQLQLTDNVGNVLTEQTSQVPILVAGEKSTTDEIFSAIVKDSETSEPDYETSKIRCSTCDVVILKNATLTKADAETVKDVNQVRDIYIYPGGKLVVPANATDYSVNNVSLRRVQDEVAAADIQAPLNITSSSKAPIFVDVRIDANNWHWFALPYDCNIADVTWADGSKAAYNTDWFLMNYDGESRAASTNPYDNHWKVYSGTTIEAGKGYIVGITGDVSKPAVKFELRFPMAQDVLTAEKDDKKVAVNAWGVKSGNKPNNLGWNLVGNPYLNYYKTAGEYSLAGLPLIKYTSSDLVVGEFYEEENGNIPFLVTPIDGGWYEYRQELASEVNMMPFTAYFVQVGDPNTHENGQELEASFEASNRGKKSIVRRAPREVEEIEEPIIVRVELTNSKGESDKTSLVIDDRFTNEYEMNGDFFKWFGDYYNYYTKPVLYTIGADQGKRAFNALNEELAKQPIPMGMYAAQAGNYTFSLNQQFDLSRVEEVWLYDATQSTYTNLMQSDYTFSTSKVNGAGRFSLSVKLAPKVATSIDNVTADKVWATTHTKQVIVNGLDSSMHLWLYDATGKLLYNEPTSNYQHTYSVPQTGTYFVSVMNGNQKQTIKVVVE